MWSVHSGTGRGPASGRDVPPQVTRTRLEDIMGGDGPGTEGDPVWYLEGQVEAQRAGGQGPGAEGERC